ncbi:Gfo/Idh/MocA family protein [Stratiformator vulcanicus]|uniref:Putative oxidoreductase YvaA n=1 Tax=Stratiformator vulcanicus TaxID=2527980 RepID=A0A517R192_9PLAN|nr:Gfo/Idh/MocA family oxidoreductase [Stratiformator vulcanicus]QDT37665.1 putative oxidoreductase YvaA [Stratiformator vulcanicus]
MTDDLFRQGFDRRRFLAGSAAAVAMSGIARPRPAQAESRDAGEKVVLALMGIRTRGLQLAALLRELPNIEIAYVCDPDERQIERGIEAISEHEGNRRPTGVRDYREALDDPAIDGLLCAAPNHWHAAATITACQAGKNVYVEKPCSHTAEEGELMISAAKDSGKAVQVGMQRRSGALYQQVVRRIREGVIGDILFAKSYYYRRRPSIGRATPESPPAWLDYDIWQGPATAQPYRPNILHYNWHNFWHWGNGEIGNNGVHMLDICRWAMDIDFPEQVNVTGSKLRFDDDQQTPDTMVANYQCGEKMITWEGISWSSSLKPEGQVGIEFRGTDGTLVVNDAGYQAFGPDRKLIEEHQADRGDTAHLSNFLDCIRGDATPQCGISDGHRSALFCHLANIAHRTGTPIEIDSKTGHLQDADAARDLWGCEYRSEWMPTVS